MKVQSKSDKGWLKHIGKLGFPVHVLLKIYQVTIVFWDLMFMGLMAYKELWVTAIFLLLPIHRKKLANEVAVVSAKKMKSVRKCFQLISFRRLSARVVALDVNLHLNWRRSTQPWFASTSRSPIRRWRQKRWLIWVEPPITTSVTSRRRSKSKKRWTKSWPTLVRSRCCTRAAVSRHRARSSRTRRQSGRPLTLPSLPTST